MKNIKRKTFIMMSSFALTIMSHASVIFARISPEELFRESEAERTRNDVWGYATEIYNILTAFVVAFAFIYIGYAAYQYATSEGDTSKAEKAKRNIIGTFIGIGIAVSAYTIMAFFREMF